MKKCNSCHEKKSLAEFYSQNKFKADGTEYVYYRPDCKECVVKKSYKWREKNPESYRVSYMKRDSKETEKVKKREFSRIRRLRGKYREWQRNNPDKVREYALYKSANREHQITDKEWLDCKLYFNDSCAYCGINNDEAKIVYDNYLHREHAIHDGANDLSNCIPACKGCNSSKHNFELIEWYTNSPDYKESRLDKISKWLNEDYKLYIKEKS